MQYLAAPQHQYGAIQGDPHVSAQFQHPTKVIHLRNLPFDVTIEELRDLCAPWGTVVAVKDKVGANKNQAFVEFATLEQAVAAVSHYTHATEPARIRSRPTYLSYSGRDRLTNVTPSSVNPTPVLMATLNDISPDLLALVNLDLLGLLFGAFASVKKLVVMARPDGGVQAWVQFPDAQTAVMVQQQLHQRQLPRHLVSDHPTPPLVDLSFCATPDLPIRCQSAATRDYTNAALPWGEPDWAMIQGLLPGADGSSGDNVPSPVLTANFESTTYPVTLDGLHTIFSTYGLVQKIHIFDREGRTTALVQYADQSCADTAKAALEGHAMYDGGHNVMRIVYSKHHNLQIRPGERSRDYTAPAPAPAALVGPPAPAAPMLGRPAGGFAGGMPMGGMPAGIPPSAAAFSGGMPAGMLRPAAAFGGGMPAGPPPSAGRLPTPQQQQQPAPRQSSGAGGAGAAVPIGSAPPEGRFRGDPTVNVTGDDYVKQHERILEQWGVSAPRRGLAVPPPPVPPPPFPPPAYGGGFAGGYGAPGSWGGGYQAPPPAPPHSTPPLAQPPAAAAAGYAAYPTASASGYPGAPPTHRPGYPSAPLTQPGYPSALPPQRPGYPAAPPTQPGYPSAPATQPGYPSAPPTLRPVYPTPQPGYPGAPPQQPGYPAGAPPPQPGYPGAPQQQPGYY